MQIKTTKRYHFTPVRMAIINKSTNDKRWMWRKGNPSALLVATQTGAATVENSMEFPQKTKNGTAFLPRDSTAGKYPKNPKTPIQKNVCTPMFIAVLFTIAKGWKQQLRCPSVNEWIEKLWYTCTMEYYVAERKKK